MKKSRLTKKISSLFVIMAMLVTMFASIGTVSVSAAFDKTTVYNWHIHNASSPDGAVTRDTTTKHSGNASLNISLNSGTFYLSNPCATLSLEKNTKYRIEYYAKLTKAGTTHNIMCNLYDTVEYGLFSASATSEEEIIDGTATGWTKYSRDFTTKNNPTMYFIFIGEMNINLDDIKLYKYTDNVLGTENLIEDGDFEATAAISHGSNDEIEGYTVSHTYAGKYFPNKLYAAVNTDKANVRTGNASLRLVRAGYANKYPSPTIVLSSNFTPTAGNSYKLTYYVKDDGDTTYMDGSVSATTTAAGIAWTMGGVTNNASNSTVFTRTDDADAAYPGWDKLEATFSNVTTAAALQVTVMAHFDGYIDDISLYQLDSNGAVTGSNLLEYGSFDLEVPDPTDYEPANPFIISTKKEGGVNNISWRNPNNDKLNKVSLYKLVSGVWTLVSDTYAVDPGKVHEAYDENLTAGTIYTYKLRFDFSDGVRREVVLSKNPKEQGAINRWAGTYDNNSGWRVYESSVDYANSNQGANYYLPNNVTIDTTEKASGKASLHIFTNKSADTTIYRPGSGINWNSYYSVELRQPMTSTVQGKYYKLTYKVKVNNATKVSALSKVLIGGGARDESSAPYPNTTDGKWVEKSLELYKSGDGTTSAVGPFRWYLGAEDVQDLWIDDITLYELDGKGGNVVANATDHMYNGGFEIFDAAEAITGQSASAGNKSVKVSWTAPADSRYIRVYEVTEGGDLLRAVCEPSSAGVTIENLKNNQNYTFKLQSQNNNGVLSDAVTVSASPVAPPYDIESDFALKLDGTAAEAVTGNGTYSVSLDVTNYTVSNFAPALIVALYKDDILVSFDKSDSQLAADEVKKTLTANVTISDYDANAKYEISAFFWNGFDTMNPLLRSISWNN